MLAKESQFYIHTFCIIKFYTFKQIGQNIVPRQSHSKAHKYSVSLDG